MEHYRNSTHQFVDDEVYMVIDKFTGFQRVGGNGFYMTKAEALAYVTPMEGWHDRQIIIRVPAIVAARLIPAVTVESSQP